MQEEAELAADELTTAEIDAEVEEAKKFRPKLTKYIITTTAESNTRNIDRVNAISAEHAKQGLFSVHVYSWRRYYGGCVPTPTSLRAFRDSGPQADARSAPGSAEAIADAVRLKLSQTATAQGAQDGGLPSPNPPALSQDGLAEALERDFSARSTG
jgi:hypothetical protein